MARPKKAPAPAPAPEAKPVKKPTKAPAKKPAEKPEPMKKASYEYMDENGTIHWDKLKNLLKEI